MCKICFKAMGVSKLKANNIYIGGSKLLFIVSKLILDLAIGFRLTPQGVLVCLVHNPIGLDKDVILAWCVIVVSHVDWEKKLLALHVLMCFKSYGHLWAQSKQYLNTRERVVTMFMPKFKRFDSIILIMIIETLQSSF